MGIFFRDNEFEKQVRQDFRMYTKRRRQERRRDNAWAFGGIFLVIFFLFFDFALIGAIIYVVMHFVLKYW